MIPLLDELLKICPHVYPMPDKYRVQWVKHIDAYAKNGWWNPGSLDSACILFTIPKKEPGTECFIVNLKPHNANMLKMHTPILDVCTIRAEIAGTPRRSVVDMAAAFEQVRIVSLMFREQVTTVTGMYTLKVMQFGDTNAPDTLNQVTNMMLQPCLGRFVSIVFDDVQLFSPSRTAHLHHIQILLTTLRWYRFYLGKLKLKWFV
jgi:hypothetical protein